MLYKSSLEFDFYLWQFSDMFCFLFHWQAVKILSNFIAKNYHFCGGFFAMQDFLPGHSIRSSSRCRIRNFKFLQISTIDTTHWEEKVLKFEGLIFFPWEIRYFFRLFCGILGAKTKFCERLNTNSDLLNYMLLVSNDVQ